MKRFCLTAAIATFHPKCDTLGVLIDFCLEFNVSFEMLFISILNDKIHKIVEILAQDNDYLMWFIWPNPIQQFRMNSVNFF